jgi:SAM-dependent methyltransferase
MTVQEVLDECKIEGNLVFLPPIQLERSLYVQVDKKLKGIGGKWNRRKRAHIFEGDPSELMGRVKNGENVNLKKEEQFFETPNELAATLVNFAFAGWTPPNPIDAVTFMEPSCGRGRIIDAYLNSIFETQGIVDYIIGIDKSERHITHCIKKYADDDYIDVWQEDVLRENEEADIIVANPPFTKNQDIDHVMAMYKSLKPGGRLVSVMSNHWRFSDYKKEKEFLDFTNLKFAKVVDLPAGTFKESGTMIAACVVIIDK